MIFLLDYLGEGQGRIFSDGKVIEGDILAVQAHCPFPDRDCWAEMLNSEDAGRQQSSAWWVQIRTRDGLVGWTDEVEKLSR